MKRFEAVILSKQEPEESSLWLRPSTEPIRDPDTGEVTKFHNGFNLWWFSPQGWRQIFDFNTRYVFKEAYEYTDAESSVTHTGTYNPEHGIDTTVFTYHLYDGTGTLSATPNLVTAKGLKKHVDELQEQIDQLKARCTALEERCTRLESRMSTAESEIDALQSLTVTHTSEITSLESKDTSLESSINSLQSSLSTLQSTVNSLKSTVESLQLAANNGGGGE